MPKRTDINSVMVIGSGPIVIGQAAEFDYSGTQACRVLREEGIRVILVNSNPATIMTDPEMADATYIEPISTPILEQIIAKERPDALLPTLGGQTALNAAMALGEAGVLKKYNVELIGEGKSSFHAGMADHDCCWYSRSARLSDGHLSGTGEKAADLYEYLRKKTVRFGLPFPLHL